MRPHRWREGCVLVPPRDQLGVVIVMPYNVTCVRGIQQRSTFRCMRLWQPLPAADIVAPVRETRSGEVEAGRDLPLERFPRRADIRGPEKASVALRTEISSPREDQVSFVGAVAPRAFCDALRMQQWKDIVIPVAGSDAVEVAVWHEIGLGLIQPA